MTVTVVNHQFKKPLTELQRGELGQAYSGVFLGVDDGVVNLTTRIHHPAGFTPDFEVIILPEGATVELTV